LYNRGMKALAPAAALGAVLAAGCTTSDSEAEIRALLAGAAEAAEARDVGFFADVIGDAYRDARGNDREQLLLAIRGYFIANQRIDVASRIDEVVLEGTDAARAVVHAGLLGRSGAALSDGVDAGLYRFDLELVNDDGEWQIIGAKWARALGE
ncbi:MAG TPA: hypothetical protein VIQ99_06210, partial [Gammaproteobacteria bacterium]